MMTNILQKYLLEILQCEVHCSKGSERVEFGTFFFKKSQSEIKKIELIHNNYTNYASLDTRKQLL